MLTQHDLLNWSLWMMVKSEAPFPKLKGNLINYESLKTLLCFVCLFENSPVISVLTFLVFLPLPVSLLQEPKSHTSLPDCLMPPMSRRVGPASDSCSAHFPFDDQFLALGLLARYISPFDLFVCPHSLSAVGCKPFWNPYSYCFF